MDANQYTPEQMAAMREWVSDCSWGDLDSDDTAELTDAEVVRGIRAHYDGGLAGFLVDSLLVTVGLPTANNHSYANN